MSYPVHPDTIVIKNEFYPNGIKEIDIWNYYQKVKIPLLRETLGRDLIFFIAVNLNKLVVLRKGKTTKFLRLNPAVYDTIITGRTISIHSTMFKAEDFGIIDIDTDRFEDAKIAALDVYDFVSNLSFIDSVGVRFTGKSSFHIVCNFKRKLYIDNARFLLEDELSKSALSKKYTVGYRRSQAVPNLDLSPNKYRGGYITLYSLSTLGLRCMELPVGHVHRFKKENARINIV